jgi:hypothetical protein
MFFIEFAVNDDQDAGHNRQECIRGMEGIIRQSLRHNPGVDIVITHFVNPSMLKQLQAGTTPLSMRAHADVAGHYGMSTIHLAKEVSERIGSGALSWEEFGGTHPKPAGNRICTDMIDQLLDGTWNEMLPDDARPVAHALPREPLDPRIMEMGVLWTRSRRPSKRVGRSRRRTGRHFLEASECDLPVCRC